MMVDHSWTAEEVSQLQASIVALQQQLAEQQPRQTLRSEVLVPGTETTEHEEGQVGHDLVVFPVP